MEFQARVTGSGAGGGIAGIPCPLHSVCDPAIRADAALSSQCRSGVAMMPLSAAMVARLRVIKMNNPSSVGPWVVSPKPYRDGHGRHRRARHCCRAVLAHHRFRCTLRCAQVLGFASAGRSHASLIAVQGIGIPDPSRFPCCMTRSRISSAGPGDRSQQFCLTCSSRSANGMKRVRHHGERTVLGGIVAPQPMD
jgi:hypothetical protein